MESQSFPLIGPAVLVSPRVAVMLWPAVHEALRRWSSDGGGRLDAELAATVAAWERLARVERQRVTPPVSGVGMPGIPADDESGMLGSVNVNEAALELGISGRAVRARLERGTLAGKLLPTGWRVWLQEAE